MKKIKITHELIRYFTLLTILILACSTTAMAKDPLPATSHDGLKLQTHSKHGAVYLKPGENLKEYDKVTMTDVYVAFKKNWQRNYNQDVMGLDGPVTDKDMETIKKRVAKEFKVIFTKVLQAKGFEVVEHTGTDVLLLRPAIINLVVTAPDIMSAGMERVLTHWAGRLSTHLGAVKSSTANSSR